MTAFNWDNHSSFDDVLSVNLNFHPKKSAFLKPRSLVNAK